MPSVLEYASNSDAAAIAALRMAVARELSDRYGRGTWSFALESESSVRLDIMTSQVLIWRHDGTVAATLRLSPRQPWLGAIDFFTPSEKPLYLTSMAVAPRFQRKGIGRACLADVCRVAAEWGADAIRLDAYDAPAGAGEFYRKYGYTEVRRAPYNGTPLIYFELMLPRSLVRRPSTECGA